MNVSLLIAYLARAVSEDVEMLTASCFTNCRLKRLISPYVLWPQYNAVQNTNLSIQRHYACLIHYNRSRVGFISIRFRSRRSFRYSPVHN